jgi:hypothetical protein
MAEGAIGRLQWAARMKRRPRSVVGYCRLLWHDFVIHPLFVGHEVCQDCGRGYPLWHAEGDLWDRVHGSPGGLLCPHCFDRQAQEAGFSIEFRAILRGPMLSEGEGK